MSNSEHLDAVGARIGSTIIEFCFRRCGQQFHADDLREYVTRTAGQVAPGSADRVLRDLRQRGAIDYIVLNRAASLYLVSYVDYAYDLL